MKSVWWEKQKEYANELQADHECDVAIVGGGIVGVACAYHLVQQGLEVSVFESRGLAEGSTGFSGGFLATSTTLDLGDLVESYGEEKAKVIHDSLGQAIDEIEGVVEKENIPCDFFRSDSLYYAEEQSHVEILEKEYEIQRKLGYQVELLRREDPRIPFSGVYGAMKSENEASANPVALLYGLAGAVMRMGGKIYTNTMIDSIAQQGEQTALKTKGGFNIKAKKVVLAVSAWPQGVSLNTGLRYYGVPLTSYVVVTKPVKGLSQRWPRLLTWNTYREYNYLRLLPDERVLIGGEDRYGDEPSHGSSDSHSAWALRLLAKLQSYFPDLDFEIDRCWGGYFIYPLDGLPVIRTQGNVTSMLTDGLPFGWLMGKMAAERIIQGRSQYDELYDYQRNFGFWKNLFLALPMPHFFRVFLVRSRVFYESVLSDVDERFKH